MLDKLQKRLWKTVGPSLAVSREPLAHRRNVASYSLTLVEIHLNQLNWFSLLILVGGQLVILTGCMIFLSPFLDAIRMSINSFFPSTARLWNSPPTECFPLTYDLNIALSIELREAYMLFILFFFLFL